MNLTICGQIEAQHRLGQSRLATPAFTHNPQCLSLFDIKRDTVHRLDDMIWVPQPRYEIVAKSKVLLEVLHLYHNRPSPPNR